MKSSAFPRFLFFTLLAFAAGVGHAQDAPNYEKVREAVQSVLPDAKKIAVSETPLPNLLEVRVDSDILYLDDSGRYLIQGRLFDLESRRDLTSDAKSVIRSERLQDIKPEQRITFAPSEPEHEIVVFTDLDCTYCRRLHSQIDEYMERGIAFHYVSFPRAGIGSASFKKAESVWCADDRQAALTRAKQGKEVEPRQCDNPVEEQFRLGRKIGVTGTPAMVTSSGILIAGYMPPGKLQERLEGLENGTSSR